MHTSPPSERSLLGLALALSLAAAVSLGITRFAYGLLLPPMRADLQWSYALAGAMNTANALGYLAGALLTPRLLRLAQLPEVLLGGKPRDAEGVKGQQTAESGAHHSTDRRIAARGQGPDSVGGREKAQEEPPGRADQCSHAAPAACVDGGGETQAQVHDDAQERTAGA